MLTGANIDDQPLMNVNILKFFEKSFGISELSRIFEMSKGNNHLKIKDMKAKNYKEYGYTHVLVENANGNEITKGFRSYREMKKYQSEMNLHEINSGCFDFMPVNQAIKKGY